MERLDNNGRSKEPSDIAQLAEALWLHCEPQGREGINLRQHGRRKDVLNRLDTLNTLATSFELIHTVVPHPSNRWWRRRQFEALFVVQGTVDELVTFLDSADELLQL